MIDINELRRLAQAALAAPDGLSAEWMDRLGQFQEAADASVVSELIGRIEAAEKDIALKERIIDSLGLGLNAAAHERDNLRAEVESWKGLAQQFGNELDTVRAKIAEMEKQEPVAWVRKLGLDLPSVSCVTDLKYRPSNIPESAYIPLYTLPDAQPAPSMASSDVSLIDEGKTQPAQSVKGFIIDDLQSQFDTEGITEHDSGDALIRLCDAIAAVEDNFAQPAPGIPEGWLRAIDEALVVAHIGVANESDTYEQAKVKLDSLIGFHVDVATDPAVNGGWKLVPINPTKTFYQCFSAYDGTSYSNPFDYDDFVKDWREALVVAPEAKP